MHAHTAVCCSYAYHIMGSCSCCLLYHPTAAPNKSAMLLTSGEVGLAGEDALELLKADRPATVRIHLAAEAWWGPVGGGARECTVSCRSDCIIARNFFHRSCSHGETKKTATALLLEKNALDLAVQTLKSGRQAGVITNLYRATRVLRLTPSAQ